MQPSVLTECKMNTVKDDSPPWLLVDGMPYRAITLSHYAVYSVTKPPLQSFK